MPLLASFENVRELGILLLSWPLAAGLAGIALVLAFSPRKRRASKWCAIACMVASVPIGFVHLSLIVQSLEPAHGPLFNYLLFLLFTLAPLLVAVGVWWFDQRQLMKDGDSRHDA
jgi:hypothetical protein